jgi:hypothetical protein
MVVFPHRHRHPLILRFHGISKPRLSRGEKGFVCNMNGASYRTETDRMIDKCLHPSASCPCPRMLGSSSQVGRPSEIATFHSSDGSKTYWIGWLLLDGKSRWHSVSMGVAAGCEGRLCLYRTKLQMSEGHYSANSRASGLPQATAYILRTLPCFL